MYLNRIKKAGERQKNLKKLSKRRELLERKYRYDEEVNEERNCKKNNSIVW